MASVTTVMWGRTRMCMKYWWDWYIYIYIYTDESNNPEHHTSVTSFLEIVNTMVMDISQGVWKPSPVPRYGYLVRVPGSLASRSWRVVSILDVVCRYGGRCSAWFVTYIPWRQLELASLLSKNDDYLVPRLWQGELCPVHHRILCPDNKPGRK